MPEITVVITAYNLERYIEQCLSELESQTFRDFAVLLVDDCSTDRTAELAVASMKHCCFPFQLVRPDKNQGSAGKARNFALNSGLVQGKYVLFLDGDDRLESNFLEVLHTRAVQTGADITLCAYDRFEDETGHVLCKEMCGFPSEILLPPDNDILCFVNASVWNKLIRMSIISDSRFPDFSVGEDKAFFLALYPKCKKIACLDEVLIHYRVHSSSVISNTRVENVEQFANELFRQYSEASEPWLRNTISEDVLIHIGVSMPLRIAGNPSAVKKKALREIRERFSSEYGWFRDNDWLRLKNLCTHGVKGLGLWVAKGCHRLGCFSLFLRALLFTTRVLRIEIKF